MLYNIYTLVESVYGYICIHRKMMATYLLCVAYELKKRKSNYCICYSIEHCWGKNYIPAPLFPAKHQYSPTFQ